MEIFVKVMLHGRQVGPSGFPIALEMEFGWVILTVLTLVLLLITLPPITPLITGDKLLLKFWEIDENPIVDHILSLEE